MISVIIPVYNAATTLAACVDSVLAQSFADIELLLVDDGSKDGSTDLCDDYACRDARVIALHQANAGPAAARNAALEVAQGEYIAFVDSDDLIHQQYLEVLFRNIQSDEEIDVACVSFVMHTDSSFSLSFASPTKGSQQILTGNEALLSMLYQRHGFDSSPWGKLYRRELFDGLRFPAVFRVYEDLYLLSQLYPLARKVHFADVPLYYYFKQDSGTLNSLSIRRNDAFDILQTLEAQFMVTGQKPLVRAVRERRLAVAMNILRLLLRQPHTDSNIAMAHLCWQHIKALRGESIHDPNARLKNRLASVLSYLIYRK